MSRAENIPCCKKYVSSLCFKIWINNIHYFLLYTIFYAMQLCREYERAYRVIMLGPFCRPHDDWVWLLYNAPNGYTLRVMHLDIETFSKGGGACGILLLDNIWIGDWLCFHVLKQRYDYNQRLGWVCRLVIWTTSGRISCRFLYRV